MSWSFVKNIFEHWNQTSRFCISKFQTKRLSIVCVMLGTRHQQPTLTSRWRMWLACKYSRAIKSCTSHLQSFWKQKEEERFRTFRTNLKLFTLKSDVCKTPLQRSLRHWLSLLLRPCSGEETMLTETPWKSRMGKFLLRSKQQFTCPRLCSSL